jgi:hypothetical protein
MRSNTLTHAERELNILVKSSTDPENRPIIEPFIPEILALVDKFGNSGQSEGSASYTAGALAEAIQKLCMQETVCPLTGIDDEWVTVADNLRQNNRCYALFRDSNGSYYLDTIVWKTQNGSTWTGFAILPNGEKISSRQYIKGFPFTPKTFEIDVIETEIAKDDWEFHVKDESQLKEVFEYYNRTI